MKHSIPPFDPATERLPPGTFRAKPEEIFASHLVVDEAHGVYRGDQYRQQLFQRALNGIRVLHRAGIQDMYMAGSFLSTKPRPGDLNLWFSVPLEYYSSHRFAKTLKSIDPDTMWTWNHSDFQKDSSGKFRSPMWRAYGLEPIYSIIEIPSYPAATATGKYVDFPDSYYRLTQDGYPCGVIQLIL